MREHMDTNTLLAKILFELRDINRRLDGRPPETEKPRPKSQASVSSVNMVQTRDHGPVVTVRGGDPDSSLTPEQRAQQAALDDPRRVSPRTEPKKSDTVEVSEEIRKNFQGWYGR